MSSSNTNTKDEEKKPSSLQPEPETPGLDGAALPEAPLGSAEIVNTVEDAALEVKKARSKVKKARSKVKEAPSKIKEAPSKVKEAPSAILPASAATIPADDDGFLMDIVERRAREANQEIQAQTTIPRISSDTSDSCLKKTASTKSATLPQQVPPVIVVAADEMMLKKSAMKKAAPSAARTYTTARKSGTAVGISISPPSSSYQSDAIDIEVGAGVRGAVPPTCLVRGRHTITTVPGAEAIFPTILSSGVTSATFEDTVASSGALESDRSGDLSIDERNRREETLLTATLVDDNLENENVLVEAKPAPEGFAAIVSNKRFKYVAAFVLLLMLSIAIPVGLLMKKGESDEVLQSATVDSTLVCGSRDALQKDYRGTKATTENGRTCQAWSSQVPHSHNYRPENFPSSGLVDNFCRNPSTDAKAWCYTTDPGARWAYCGIPMCNETEVVYNDYCGTLEMLMDDYRGSINVTATGKTCQRWDQQSPHTHVYGSDQFNVEENYCRTVDEDHPWCYTDDPDSRWEHCDIPVCGAVSIKQADYEPCENCSPGECGTDRLGYSDYRGTVNTTQKGNACVTWNTIKQNTYTGVIVSNAEEGVFEMNYCRAAVDGPKGRQPWCVVDAEHTTPEYCDVPHCEDTFVPRRMCGTRSKSQSDYRGDIMITKTGRKCVNWEPTGTERESTSEFPWDGLVANYCRNPKAGRPSAWCYVADGPSAFEFCDVSDCQECGSATLNRTDYRGMQSLTRSGKRCVPWESKVDLLLLSNMTRVPEEWGLEADFCRNPAAQQENVWCYTEKGSDEWDYCDVPDCAEEGHATNDTCGSVSARQVDYRGYTNKTVSGRTCQSWSSQSPHSHKYTPQERPQDGLDGNFCRNPTIETNSLAWCFTNDENVRWEYCAIQACEDKEEALLPTLLEECGTLSLQQKDYRGSINATSTGIPCQAWSSQQPHPHRFIKDSETSKAAGLEDGFCRNPDGSNGGAWCFTVDSDVLWQYCDVPTCSSEP